ncbi:uncharacterized protein LOC130086985 [Rhinichthys klamathensis goyatoka]|uniref:uncharacterized protein LOC130086985 n=1 Tax=Rhinichthys klamathensis goyatoka TaxID=3034132 RepID=UPI0024B59AA8|nr:uncharacterized protein LOC130086985 [Rhinichthys klamathensis goyatoka]
MFELNVQMFVDDAVIFTHGEELELVTQFKYPGVILDSNISFKKHKKGVSGADTAGVPVSVTEGDSITLNTGVVKTQQDRIRWYYNDNRIAQISGDLSKMCTDVQCNEGNGRFRDRLKLDHQTGSLTITNIRNTDSGVYQLLIFSISSISEKIFNVSVTGVSAAEQDKMKTKSVKQGESVTLDPGVRNKPNALMTWYFKDTFIAQITGDQTKICTDVQCEERFRDRLKLDHHTGSLTITHTRPEDSGEYKLQISRSSRRNRRSISSVKSFDVIVTVPGSGPSSAVVAGVTVAVLLVCVASAVGVMYLRHRSSRKERLHTDCVI